MDQLFSRGHVLGLKIRVHILKNGYLSILNSKKIAFRRIASVECSSRKWRKTKRICSSRDMYLRVVVLVALIAAGVVDRFGGDGNVRLGDGDGDDGQQQKRRRRHTGTMWYGFPGKTVGPVYKRRGAARHRKTAGSTAAAIASRIFGDDGDGVWRGKRNENRRGVLKSAVRVRPPGRRYGRGACVRR